MSLNKMQSSRPRDERHRNEPGLGRLAVANFEVLLVPIDVTRLILQPLPISGSDTKVT